MEHAEFEHIAPEIRRKSIGIALAYSTDTNQAEDMAQEVMLRLWTPHKEISGQTSAKTGGMHRT